MGRSAWLFWFDGFQPYIRSSNLSPEAIIRTKVIPNLDEAKYGTFAEIGAGQEVARQFFQAGGAAGTIAKSIQPTT